MKITFAIPDDVGRKFRKTVPMGNRSALVTSLLCKKLRSSPQSLEAVCQRVNWIGLLKTEMAGWEWFDNQTT